MTSSPVAEQQHPTAPRRRSTVDRYVAANPFSVLLAAIVLVTGLISGTFWGQFPQEFAAGMITTGQLAFWWTPVTALFIVDSPIGGIMAVALTLTAGAYAERRLGSIRSIVLFLVTGIIAMLLGVGLQALTLAWGSDWADIASIDLVLDPSVGVVGMIMAASALAPVLWQRRIRVIGFTVLLMFALYAADSDSVFRLIAGVLGLLAGAVISRGTDLGTWHRSSYREVRTIVAAIVAATGLGPIIVLISGSYAAPLSAVVAGFIPTTETELPKSCVDDFTSDCLKQAEGILTAGAGPFLVSIVPLLLTLLAAWGLRTGRRAAWTLGVVVNAAIAVLTGAVLGADQLLDATARDALRLDDGIAIALATLVPVAVVVLLLITRQRFRVAAPRRAAVRFGAIILGSWVVLALVYVVTGLLDGDDYLDGHPSLGDLLANVLRPFTPAGFLPDITVDAIPVGGAALIVYQWIGVLFWAVFLLATAQLYRATRVERHPAGEQRYRALLKVGGGGTLGFMGTWAGNSHWFSADGTGAVAYRVINGIALTVSDPVCAPGAERRTVEEFVHHCEAQGWSACFYSFHERLLPVFQSFGWQYLSVGEETVLDLPGFELTGKPWQKVRQPLNRGLREGITTLWSTWDELPAPYVAQIEAVSEEWVANKKLPEMGFTLGGMDELKDPDVGIFLAINKDGGIEATTSWLPSWTDGRITGWTIDFMRRGDGAMPGIMEFIIASAALHMKEQGAQVMSLSGAPLASKPGTVTAEPTIMDRLLEWLGSILEPAYGFTSLFRFKSKFNPRYDTIYMAYADPARLATIGMAIGNAYLPHATPKEYLALVQTISDRGDQH